MKNTQTMNITRFTTEGKACRNLILNNQEATMALAGAISAESAIETLLVYLNDQKLNKIFFGKEINLASFRGCEHLPVITNRMGNDGIEREVVIPWDKATHDEKENFEMPVRKLFKKTLDIMLRNTIKCSNAIKREHGMALLTVVMPPREATIEQLLVLAREISDFRKDFLTY